MKAISAYGDYRIFLRDFYEFHRKDSVRFSWRAIARRAGLNNPNFLRQVMLGERNLSEKTIESVGKALGLSGRELEFWQTLVRFCQSKPGNLREKFWCELLRMRESFCTEKISEGISEYYRYWYMPAIRELVTLYDFQGNYELLAKSLIPRIRQEEARAAVELLRRFHFIEKNPEGRWIQTHCALHSGTPEERFALLRYHAEMLGMAAQSLRKFSREDRLVAGMTIGVSRACYKMILAEAEKFKNRVAALVHHDSESDTVLQLALQIFPVASSPSSAFFVGEGA